jgi:REP element-mobilizing transposase RayT
VAALNVQLVFVTRYRRGVLTGEHLGTLGEVFASVCPDFGAELVEVDGEDDPVHLLVAYPPHVAVARLVNSLKDSRLGGCANAAGWAPTGSICGPRLISRPRLVAHRWRPSGVPLETLRRTSARSAPLADRANSP